MLAAVGDIWAYAAFPICIPTNIGWTSDGKNPMGVGVAKQAAERFPGLPAWYGAHCKANGVDTELVYYQAGNLIMFPTKPLNKKEPNISWKNKATLNKIQSSAYQLRELTNKMKWPYVVLPLVGCGAGGQPHQLVLPILRYYLDDRFGLILYEATHAKIMNNG